jgi:hypothetical protein
MSAGALGVQRSQANQGSGVAAATPEPTRADADRLLASVIDRAHLTIGEGTSSLVTELHDAALGAIRLAVSEGPNGQVRAELSSSDPAVVELLRLAAAHHRAGGDLTSVDLHIRSSGDQSRLSGSSTGTGTGPAPDLGGGRDGRRSNGNPAPQTPAIEPLLEPRGRARRETGLAVAGASRLGRTIDRTA